MPIASFHARFFTTRLHFNGMHTARLLTVSQHALGGGRCLPRGCICPGVSARGVCLGVSPRVVSVSGPEEGRQTPPPVDRQTPVKTEPSQTSFACGKNRLFLLKLKTTTVNFDRQNNINSYLSLIRLLYPCSQRKYKGRDITPSKILAKPDLFNQSSDTCY